MSSLRARSFADLFTFTRASAARYCNAAGVLASAAVDEPRVEYDPDTRLVRGLLIEQSASNFLLQSQDFATTWAPTRATVSTNLTAAPDGTTTGDKLVDDATAANSHYVAQSYTKVSSTEVQTYAASIWLKAGERTKARLQAQGTSGSANSAYALFDLSNGTASAVTVAGQFDNGNARIEKWAGGWYRCILEFRVNNDGQAAVQVLVLMANSAGSTTYDGDGASGLSLWGAQLEKTNYATSYIATTTVAVTRSADVCSAASLTPWFNEDEGTVLAEMLIPWTYLASETVSARRILSIDAGAETNRHLLYLNAGNNRIAMTTSSVQQADLSTGAYTAGAVRRHAYAWSSAGASSVATGGAVASDSAVTLPTGLTAFRLGVDVANSAQPNSYLRKVRFFPRRLSENELRALVA